VTAPLGGFGRSDFGEAEARLRNTFGLEGRLPNIELDTKIVPVILVGNGLAPGLTTRRNQRWMSPFTVSASSFLVALEPIIITKIIVYHSAAAAGDVKLKWNDTGVIAKPAPTGALLDLNNRLLRPPVGAIGGATSGIVIAEFDGILPNTLLTLDFGEDGFMLGDGVALNLSTTAAVNINGLAFGRIP
jgi:hypothetical protein